MTKYYLLIFVFIAVNISAQKSNEIGLKHYGITLSPEYKWHVLADDSLTVLLSENGAETVYIYNHDCKTGYDLERLLFREYNFGDTVSLVAAYRPKFTDGDIYVVDVEGFRRGASMMGRAVGILLPEGGGYIVVGISDERVFRPDFKFVPYRLLKTIKKSDQS